MGFINDPETLTELGINSDYFLPGLKGDLLYPLETQSAISQYEKYLADYKSYLDSQNKLKSELNIQLTDYQILEQFKSINKSDKMYPLYETTLRLLDTYQSLLSCICILNEENKGRNQLQQNLFAIINDQRIEFKEESVGGDGWCTLNAIGINNPSVALEELRIQLNNNEIIKRYLLQAMMNNLYAIDLGEEFDIAGVDSNGKNIAQHINMLRDGLQNDTVSFIELLQYLSRKEVLSAYIDYLMQTKYVDENIAAACLSLQGKRIAAFHNYLGTGQLHGTTIADDVNLEDPNTVCIIFHPSVGQATAHYNILHILPVPGSSASPLPQAEDSEKHSYIPVFSTVPLPIGQSKGHSQTNLPNQSLNFSLKN